MKTKNITTILGFHETSSIIKIKKIINTSEVLVSDKGQRFLKITKDFQIFSKVTARAGNISGMPKTARSLKQTELRLMSLPGG